LLDLGNWIFGALIAFDLLILSALLTVGPLDTAVLIASAAIALALPPDIAGFLLLRLAADMKSVDLEQVATETFVEVGFELKDRAPGQGPDEAEQRRARVVLRYSYALLALSFVLTFIGVTAALWHMAWWIGAAFVAMAAVSQAIFFRGGGLNRWQHDVEHTCGGDRTGAQIAEPLCARGLRRCARYQAQLSPFDRSKLATLISGQVFDPIRTGVAPADAS
jgi:hypothetical protein